MRIQPTTDNGKKGKDMGEFTGAEQKQLYEKIRDLYFNRNFGSMSKTDLETLLFSEYIEHRITAKEKIDDYTLSRELGISQSRVRALKERKELKYPQTDFDWRTSFAEEIKNAKYDETDHYIKVIIQDVNVMTEVRHFIEECGWYDECSLNRKLLRIPLDCFTEICIEKEEINGLFSEDVKKELKKLAPSDSAVSAFLADFTKDGLKSFLMSASKSVLSTVLPMLPFGGIAKTAFGALASVIKKL